MTDASQARCRRRYALIFALLFLGPSMDLSAQQAAAGDIDSFMEKVLQRRKVNQDALKDYVLNDVEQVEAKGPGDFTLYRGKREYLWYVRDGIHVRSPVRFNGVTISKEERKESEDKWIREERQKAKRKAEKAKSQQPAVSATADQSPPDPDKPSFVAQLSEPRFVSEAYFLDFKFEAGNYYLVAKEQFEGREVLVIEYYPKNLFRDDDDDNDAKRKPNDKPPKEPSKKDKEKEELIERQMNKTSLVTLWVDPEEFQIVKYTFSNVWMDFLPAGWMLRVDHLKASMDMSQAIPGVWLPREMSVQAGVSLAVGRYTVRYERKFSDYRRAEVTTTILPGFEEKK